MTDGVWIWPQGEAAWQRAANAAAALLQMDRLRVPRPGAVPIDRSRCEEVLAHARQRGIEPREDALVAYAEERAARFIPPRPDEDLRGLPPR